MFETFLRMFKDFFLEVIEVYLVKFGELIEGLWKLYRRFLKYLLEGFLNSL